MLRVWQLIQLFKKSDVRSILLMSDKMTLGIRHGNFMNVPINDERLDMIANEEVEHISTYNDLFVIKV